MAGKHSAPVIAVLNMKGGVGKTTVAGNVFRELYRRIGNGSKTLLVDFDAQFNLTQLVLSRKHYEDLQTKKSTLWHVFEPNDPPNIFDVTDRQRATIDDYKAFVHQLKRSTSEHELLLVPGDFRVALLNLREKPESLETPRKRFKDFIRKAREDCALIVLDCNPSSSFLTRCAIEVATHLLVPIRSDKYSVLGLEILNDYVRQLPTLSSLPEFLIVMNGENEHTLGIEQELRKNAIFGSSLLVPRIPQSGVLSARPDYTGFGVDRGVSHSKIIRKKLCDVADQIAKKIKLLP